MATIEFEIHADLATYQGGLHPIELATSSGLTTLN